MPNRYRGKRLCPCKKYLPGPERSKPSRLVPIDSLPFALVHLTLRLELHRKRDDVVDLFAMIAWPDDLLPAHRTFGCALAGLGALVLAGYQGFHETCVAEQVAFFEDKGISQCMCGRVCKGDAVPQWVAVRSFMVSMQMMHCNVDSFTGLSACSCCALMVAIRCCSRTLDKPVSSSTSCEGVSPSLLRPVAAEMHDVEWRLQNGRQEPQLGLQNKDFGNLWLYIL